MSARIRDYPSGPVQVWCCLNPAHQEVTWDGEVATCAVCGLTSQMTAEFANEAAEHCAEAILAHMNAHGPKEPGSAWRRHLSTAARVAAGAFLTREDMLAGAVEAIQRGDFIVCPALREAEGGWEFGVKHTDGEITVHITGHAFPSRIEAERKAAEYDAGDEFGECPECDNGVGPGKHTVVQRHVGGWRDVAEIDKLLRDAEMVRDAEFGACAAGTCGGCGQPAHDCGGCACPPGWCRCPDRCKCFPSGPAYDPVTLLRGARFDSPDQTGKLVDWEPL